MTRRRPLQQPIQATASGEGTPQAADILVVFGITGDLAKVMTFRSLYRLETARTARLPDRRRGRRRLDRRPAARARARVDRRHRRAARRGGVRALREAALVRRRATSATPRPTSASRRRSTAPRRPVFYLEIPPFLFGRVVKGLADAGLTKTARVVVEKPFGHDRPSAQALADELHQYIDESQLYRIDHFLGKMGIEELLYLRFANTMLEPVWNRNYIESRADHDGRELRRRRPRPLLRPGRRAAGRRRQPPDAGRRGGGDGGAVGRRSGDDQGRAGRARSARSAEPIPRTTCAASTTATARSTASRRIRRRRRTRHCASRSTTGAGPACRSSSARARSCR